MDFETPSPPWYSALDNDGYTPGFIMVPLFELVTSRYCKLIIVYHLYACQTLLGVSSGAP
jgi:hypothetical protein